MEKTQKGGIIVSAYPSPEDGTMVIHVDTPDVAEDSRGPLIRLYLNDDSVYENPPYLGSRDELIPQSPSSFKAEDTVARYGEVSWTFGDVTSLEAWNENWTPDQAEEFLQQNARHMRDRLISVGFEVMEDLLANWTPEGASDDSET